MDSYVDHVAIHINVDHVVIHIFYVDHVDGVVLVCFSQCG